MKNQKIRLERDRSYPMPPAEAWRLLGDTDHLNRAIGLPSVEFSATDDPLIRNARARAFGVVPVRWREFPFDWVRERRYAVRREFESGPVATIVVGIELRPDGPGVTVVSYAECTTTGVFSRAAWRLARGSVTDLLDFCDRYLARKEEGRADPVPPPKGRPAVDRAQLDQRLGRLASAPVRPELVTLLKDRIEEGSEDQLTGIRPFALADQWGADRLDVLRLFLHATPAGLVELRWELMCPNCRVPKLEADALARLPVQFHCDTCGIAYDTDFDQRVELRFSVHPAIRKVTGQVYCIGGPLRTPHIIAQQYLRPHEDRQVELTLTRPVQLRTVRAAHRLLLTPEPGKATLQEFRELFSSEALAPDRQLAVSHIAFLFSDLKGSTRLYEGIGDAPAYSRISRHFDFITREVSRGGGSVIKTMGDGVMCAFYRLDDALATAIRLQDEVGGWCQDQGIDPPLALKVGVRHGPAIAMTANGRLDYFGRTVNLAARVADQSRGGDVVVLREVLDQAGGPALGGPGLAAEPFTTRLRGLDSDQHLVRLARQDASTIIRTTTGPS